MKIKYSDVPSDLEDMIDEGEFIHGDFSKDFEKAMFHYNLMDYGTSRRSHRIITEKCKKLGADGTTELLTGKTIDEIYKETSEKYKQSRIEEMHRIAKDYGYTICSA